MVQWTTVVIHQPVPASPTGGVGVDPDEHRTSDLFLPVYCGTGIGGGELLDRQTVVVQLGQQGGLCLEEAFYSVRCLRQTYRFMIGAPSPYTLDRFTQADISCATVGS